MLLKDLRAYLCSGHRVCECTPYGRQTWVYKLDEDIFALLSHMDRPPHLTLKCDPNRALILRSIYQAIQPSTFMNRRHWNTIAIDGRLDDGMIELLINEAYALVDQNHCPTPFHSDNDS